VAGSVRGATSSREVAERAIFLPMQWPINEAAAVVCR
jgi:hypothetical protein